jgi:hypothetical protein
MVCADSKYWSYQGCCPMFSLHVLENRFGNFVIKFECGFSFMSWMISYEINMLLSSLS